ncbi:MAG TPA: Tox-REase-5 domain-containing protein, partial [Stellaceae bacterium]
ISDGTLPDRPDLSFEYDEGARRLRLYRQDNDGRSLVFEGRPDADGIIRDDAGHAIGRKLDGSVVIIDPDTLPGSGSDRGGAGPKLCPDPGDDRPGGKKDKDIAYQAYVSSLVNPEEPLEPGLAVKLFNPITGNDVYFDDCRRSDGTMIEAKGTGYLEMLEKESDYPWDGVEAKMLRQARSQLQAAGARPIEWHFAEREVADYVRDLFRKQNVQITVIYSPPPG